MSNRDHPSFMPSGKPVLYDSRRDDAPARRETPRERMARIRATALGRLRGKGATASAPTPSDRQTGAAGGQRDDMGGTP